MCNRALSGTEIQALYNAAALPATCGVSSPANGAVVTTPNPTINATVIGNGNLINRAEFLSGATFLGAVRTAPYT